MNALPTLSRSPAGHDRAPREERDVRSPRERAGRLDPSVSDRLAGHTITVLRVSLGLVFLAFGALKFVPGLSPAEDLVVRTLDALSFGIIGPEVALVLTAVTEVFIGLTLVSGRLLRVGLAVLAAAMIGIVSPVVLFAGELFGSGPTLEAQYVLKDIVLIAAALVVAAHASRRRARRRTASSSTSI